VQTATKVVELCLLMTTDPGDLVLDPTCGSGTTAYVAEQWGRPWITIDTSRVALARGSHSSYVSPLPLLPPRRLLGGSAEGIGADWCASIGRSGRQRCGGVSCTSAFRISR